MAAEADGPYVSGHVGLTIPRDTTTTYSNSTVPGYSEKYDFDTGLAVDLALGYRVGPMRMEGEIGYQKSEVDDVTAGGISLKSLGLPFSADMKATSFMLNGYYDFHNSSALTPYITAGLGMAKVKVSANAPDLGIAYSDSDIVFAYQFGAGLEYAVNKNVSLDARYRYFAISDPSFPHPSLGDIDTEFASHNLMLGARIKF